MKSVIPLYFYKDILMNRKGIKYLTISTLLMSAMPSFSATKTFYDITKAETFESATSGDYFIQVGNFINQSNANKLERHIHTQIQYPVAVHQKNDHYIVLVGPMHTDMQVRAASKQLSSIRSTSYGEEENHQQKTTNPIEFIEFKDVTIKPFEKDAMLNAHPWFVGIGVGAQQLNTEDPMMVKNGSIYPTPNNFDQFWTTTDAQAVVAAEAGYRWQPNQQWFPSYSASLYYNHLFSTNIGNHITQYSIPEFRNYIYNWTVSSDVLLALAKLNLFNYEQFSPFVQGGIGVAFNHASNFNEAALPGVTQRISPAFADNTNCAFAYALGIGIDWSINTRFILSLGYQFQDMGNVYSGRGVTTWSGDVLKTNTYQTNLALLKINYYL